MEATDGAADAEAGATPSDGGGPATGADALDEMGDEICRLAAHVHAATRRYLELVAEFDRRRGWEPAGHRSCARWLAFRTGHDLRTARDHVRVARALEELPRTDAAMARGRLTPEVGALLQRALEAAEDALYRRERAAVGRTPWGCWPSGRWRRASAGRTPR